jgi:serine/threonine-protein kinase
VKIKSEHVARVRDVGTLASGAPFIVLDHLSGHDLDDEIAARGTLPCAEAVELGLQLCEALAQAHALGIVHRDLKPANLFLARHPDGSVCLKVLDFGVSTLLGDGETSRTSRLTGTSTIIGSPLYLAPELWESARNATPRSDIWAVGAILFELLTGRPPFVGETMAEVCGATLAGDTPSLRALAPAVPAGMEAAVHRCLARRPEHRYEHVAELAVALVPYGRANVSRLYARRIHGVLAEAGIATGPLHIPGDSLMPASIEVRSALAPPGGPQIVSPSAPTCAPLGGADTIRDSALPAFAVARRAGAGPPGSGALVPDGPPAAPDGAGAAPIALAPREAASLPIDSVPPPPMTRPRFAVIGLVIVLLVVGLVAALLVGRAAGGSAGAGTAGGTASRDSVAPSAASRAR